MHSPYEYNTRGQNTQEQHREESEIDLADYEDDGEQEWQEAQEPYTEEEVDELLASIACGDDD